VNICPSGHRLLEVGSVEIDGRKGNMHNRQSFERDGKPYPHMTSKAVALRFRIAEILTKELSQRSQ
jgi:hypothetical protein